MPELQRVQWITARAGLTRSERRRSAGFTVLELLIVITIMLVIAALAVPGMQSAIASARNARATSDVRTLGNAALGWYLQYGSPPATLNDIGYGGQNDPWGSPYQYLNISTNLGTGVRRTDRFGVPINTYFEMYSMGPNRNSAASLSATQSQDDIIWANDGFYIGGAASF
jgi:general secretion pathway protein G